MVLVYSLVSRGTCVLAEYTNTNVSGNFATVTRVLLTKIPPAATRQSYIYDQHVFHYVVDVNGVTFLTMSDDQKPRIPFAFLAEIEKKWKSMYADSGTTAIAFSMNEEFGSVMGNILNEFNDNAENNRSFDTISTVQGQIDQVKGVMIQNIEKVLERGEKIELLVDKTDRLNAQAFKFEKQSRRLKDVMWWKKVKFYGVVSVIICVMLFVISAMACGGVDFNKCR